MYSVDKKIICKRLFDLKIFSLRKIAAIVDISHMTVKRWSEQNENELRNSKYHLIKRKQQKSGTHVVEALRALIQSSPTFLLEDLRIKIKDLFGFFISKSFLCSILHKKCNLSRKKVRFFGKSNDKEKIIESFLLKRQEYKAKNKFFISLDETSFSRKGKDIFGYSLKGTKIQIQRQWKRLTSKSALSYVDQNGLLQYDVIEGSFNRVKFLESCKKFNITENSVVLMDNVRFHHSKDVL